MANRTEYLELEVEDGTSLRAYAAYPGREPLGGLIVCQEAFGVNAHIRELTERFAQQGYLSVAPELFHRTAPPGFEGGYSDFASVMPHLRAMRDPSTEADLRAAQAWLATQEASKKIAVIGFCMGGRVAFLAALGLPVCCAVSFYGGGIAPDPNNPGLLDRVDQLRAPVLLFWGGRDQHIGPQQRDAVVAALRKAQKSFANVEFSDADHAFFREAGARYHPAAAAEAWALTLEFLRVHSAGEKARSAD
jgi:carboxymethylenebutenolidase